MRYHIAAVAFALAPWPAQAEAWRLAGTSHLEEPRENYAATFVDTASIRRDGDKVTFRSLVVWEENISSGDNSRLVLSANCRDRSFQDLQVAHYKGARFVEHGTLRPRTDAIPHSAQYRVIDSVCGVRPWLTRVLQDPYKWSRSAFRKLHAGGHWPLDIGR